MCAFLADLQPELLHLDEGHGHDHDYANREWRDHHHLACFTSLPAGLSLDSSTGAILYALGRELLGHLHRHRQQLRWQHDGRCDHRGQRHCASHPCLQPEFVYLDQGHSHDDDPHVQRWNHHLLAGFSFAANRTLA